MSSKSTPKSTPKGDKVKTKKSAKKLGKDAKLESEIPLLHEIKAKVALTPKELLEEKTQAKLSRLHSLTVCLLQVTAESRGFHNLQFVTLQTEKTTLPAFLIFDNKIKNMAVIKDETSEEICEGEDVVLTPQCPRLFAEEVGLCLLNADDLSESVSFLGYLKEQLISHCLRLKIGMNIVINYLTQDFVLRVTNIKYFAMKDISSLIVPAQCIQQTCINVENEKKAKLESVKEKISFRYIGGHKVALQNLQQEIESFFSQNGIGRKTTKGILISGASGCGKSLIGEALKNKYSKSFLSAQVEDLKSKFIGETEQRLKKYFTKAVKRAPCILFIDDLDILCSSRDKGSSAGIVTALLHLMDGVTESSSEGVLVIATASDPKCLDAALRRPGRLSFDVFLQAPDEKDRKDVFEKLLYRLPNNLTDEDLQDLAFSTPGYVGGDLRRVVMEALVQAEEDVLRKETMVQAINAVKPAALKTSNTAERELKLSDICGYDQLKQHLLESVKLTLQHSAIFLECGIAPPSRFFLFGPPGCGKTSLVMAIADEFHLNIIPVKRSTVFGKYFGESEQNLTNIFLKAQESSPCIILFENFDGIAGTKGSDDGGGLDAGSRIINHLKVQLDGIVRNDGVFIFAETNRPDLVNKDVLRPGRFHEYHFVDLPLHEDRKAIIEKNILSENLEGVTIEEIVSRTAGFTVAEIFQFCAEMRLLKEESVNLDQADSSSISSAQVEEALLSVVPNTSQRMKNRYQLFAQTYCSIKNKTDFR